MSEKEKPAGSDNNKCTDDDRETTLDFSWHNESEKQQKEKEKIDYFDRVRQNLEISKNLKGQIKRDLAQRKKMFLRRRLIMRMRQELRRLKRKMALQIKMSCVFYVRN